MKNMLTITSEYRKSTKRLNEIQQHEFLDKKSV